jgi:predicted DNA-binding transcriptional regulator AlpA
MDIEALAREIAHRLDPEALLDAEDVGAYLKCSSRYVLEGYAVAPGFPKAIRLTGPDGRRSQPRWRKSDITAWVSSHLNGRRKQGGRPRNTIED